jgi:hypothetical protein
MSLDFVQEIIEGNGAPKIIGCLTGWEEIVFEPEEEPFSS